MVDWVPDIERLQAFDDEQWAAVERNFAGRLMAYVARRVGDLQAREDIVQESFLGAVRGIEKFDRLFTFEQYLFGICRNRTIDFLRRRKASTLDAGGDGEDERPPLDHLARDNETPSGIIRDRDLLGHGRELLTQVLRDWVQETWEVGEFTRLMVVEALFSGGWRNRDTWQRFDLRDETAVAGIKFRALKRMREIASQSSATGELLAARAEETQDGHTGIDVATIWSGTRASCPARHWLARKLADTLEPGPEAFVRFHLEEMGCEWCQANLDDLAQHEDDLEPLLERVRSSNAHFLRSRSLPS